MERSQRPLCSGLQRFGAAAGPPTQLVEPTVAGLARGLAAWLDPAIRAQFSRPSAPADLRAYSWERVLDRYEQALVGQKVKGKR